jgi:UDP-N-acetylmuramate--alanine ligase
MKIKVGIFFGGPSREREISFAGGRTVYDNLDKSVFEPIPIFVDSHRNFIQLDWPYLYKGSIRDFYPPVTALPGSPNHFQVYQESVTTNEAYEQVGKIIPAEELPQLINVAFLALHGVYGEDGQIQRELEKLRIPYTGSGVRACEIGMDKGLQKEMMSERGFATPPVQVVKRHDWLGTEDVQALYNQAAETIGFPIVIRPANQGSSIGVSIVDEKAGLEGFREAIDRAFFRETIPVASWRNRSTYDRVDHVRYLTDIRDGLGFPLDITFRGDTTTLHHPEELLQYLNRQTEANPESEEVFLLTAHLGEEKVILEGFITGKEFSCIVIRKEDGGCVALPPTEIVKGGEVFDYRSKYMPGRSRKETPIKLPTQQINTIRQECERLFEELGFHTYARIDGFITDDEQVFLNDPNTTSGMLPSSFFFHQAAEIGLNPSQFLTYIIRTSIQERMADNPKEAGYKAVLSVVDEQIQEARDSQGERKRIGVVLGGTSFERHISVESGRNIYEKLSSSEQFHPIPYFLADWDASGTFELYQLPISLLLKDNADDIRDKVRNYDPHPVLADILNQCRAITEKYAGSEALLTPRSVTLDQLPAEVDQVFIALHGRPGEDGTLQAALDERGLSYNGSGPQSSGITIDKYRTLQTLKKNGFSVTQQLLLDRSDYQADPTKFVERIEQQFAYPLIAKPVDDGCSSAVIVINKREELQAYARLLFRPQGSTGEEARRTLRLGMKEEFPIKDQVLFEILITAEGATRFLEITGGLVTHIAPDGTIEYEVFEPSEALSSGEVLSVEEKFLAGEGQNITPARFAEDPEQYDIIARQVKADLEKAARILDVQGYARIDAFVRVFSDHSVETIIVEVNSLPGMTPATAIFHQAALNGYQPAAFIGEILQFADRKDRIERAIIEEQTQSQMAESTAEETILGGAAEQPQGMNEAQEQTSPKDNVIKRIGKNIWGFLSAPIFLRNLAVMTGFVVLFFFLLKGCLNLYTNHGKSLEVHDYRGMTLNEAKQKARQRSFSVVVLDSVFLLNRSPNEVIDQTPRPFSQVKENRNIYLTITRSVPPEVPLPSLIGSDEFEQYRRKLERLNIDLVVRDKQYDRKLEENTILFLYYDGERIAPQELESGVKVPKGSTVGAIITVRNTGQAQVPNLVCQRFSEASFNISSRQLVVGRVEGASSNPDDYFVWRQEPEAGAMLSIGQPVNIYLQAAKPEGCQ